MQSDTATDVVNDQTHQTHATTAFTADDSAKISTPVDVSLSRRYDVVSSVDYSRLALHQLLSQPVIVNQGVLNAGTPVFLTFFSHSALLENSPFHLEKLRGYYGIRATVVVRVVCNADKYTQGRVAISYYPVPSVLGGLSRSDHRHVTQLQHAELDFNLDTEIVLKIPHRGPYTHFDITNKRYDTGIFQFTETLAHRGNPIPYTIYMSFEDVDLLGPTATDTVTYQGNLEIEAQRAKPLSEKVKELGSAMMDASGVPLIGSYIQPVAWATALTGRVMSIFGFSRPLITQTPTVYLQRAAAKLNASDGTEYAEAMAMTTTTGVKVTDQIGLTGADEMSYAYLCGIRSQVYRFSYGVATVSGTKLLSFPLDPMSMQSISLPSSTGLDKFATRIMHPMAYLANIHSFYRGSIEVSLEISKTIFHSGRLLVVFEPYNPEWDNGGVVAPSRINDITDAVNCHKDIVDIRSGNNFAFKFPYTATLPYLKTGQPYGYVHIFVLNNLVRNDTNVSDLVDVGVRVKACEDMEFQCATDPVYWPMLVSSTDVTADPLTRATLPIVYESGLEVKDDVIITKPIGSAMTPSQTVTMAEYCVAEKLMSLKQIAMRSALVFAEDVATEPYSRAHDVCQFATSTSFSFNQDGWYDFYSYAGAPFAYGRGGVIITIFNQGPSPKQVSLFSDTYGRVESASPNKPVRPYGQYHLVGTVPSYGADRFYVPPYDQSIVRWNVCNLQDIPSGETTNANSTLFTTGGYSTTKFWINSRTTGNFQRGHYTYRSAADDTQFGGFLGIPHMTVREPFASQQSNGGSPRATAFAFPSS